MVAPGRGTAVIEVRIDPDLHGYAEIVGGCKASQRGELTVRARTKAYRAPIIYEDTAFTVEVCGQVSGGLEIDLLRTGDRLIRVSRKPIVGAPRSARTPGKSESIDAASVAHAAIGNRDLPGVLQFDRDRKAALLTGHIDRPVSERTKLENELRWLSARAGSRSGLFSQARRGAPNVCDGSSLRPDASSRAWKGRSRSSSLRRIAETTSRVNELERELGNRMGFVAPRLLEVLGWAALTAAKIAAKTAGRSRLASDARFALQANAERIVASSGAKQRQVLSLRGSRQLNSALHRVSLSKSGCTVRPRDYIACKKAFR